jgi:hypothetical protein
MTTIVATADTFVSLRRIFFIEVILSPAAICSLMTAAHASEQRREGSAGYQRKADPPSPLRMLASQIQHEHPTLARPAELYPRLPRAEHNP